MSKHYGLRITCDIITNEHKVYFENHGMLLCVKETGKETEKPHFHLLFQGDDKKMLQQMKVYTGKYWAGNEGHSWTRVLNDLDAYIRYCLKGESIKEMPNVVFNIGYDIETYHYEFYKHQTAIKQAKEEVLKSKKTAYFQCYDDLKTEYKSFPDKYKLCGETYMTELFSGYDIFKWHIRNGSLPPNKWQMFQVEASYKGRYIDEEVSFEDKERMLRQCYDDLYRSNY